MKKMLYVLFVLCIIFLCGCNNPIISYSITEDSSFVFYEDEIDVTKISIYIERKNGDHEIVQLTDDMIKTDLSTLQLWNNEIIVVYENQELVINIIVLSQDMKEDSHVICEKCGKCSDVNCYHPAGEKCLGHFEIETPIIFEPGAQNELFKEEMENAFYKKNLSEKYEYSGFYNYLPEEISKKYNIAATMIRYENIENPTYSMNCYYLYYNGKLYNVDKIGSYDSSIFRGFVHFAITDYNKDGYFEITTSYHLESRISITYISMFDTKSEFLVDHYGIYNQYIYFKAKDKKISMYSTPIEGIENANAFYTSIVNNYKKYVFDKTYYELECDTYKVEITIDEHIIHFPMLFEGIDLYFIVNVKMTYLGETFSYTNSNSYLHGANTKFISEEEIIQGSEGAGADVITFFTIKTGDVIERQYFIRDSLNYPNKAKTYDMEVSYRFSEEILTVKDVLKITYQQ